MELDPKKDPGQTQPGWPEVDWLGLGVRLVVGLSMALFILLLVFCVLLLFLAIGEVMSTTVGAD